MQGRWYRPGAREDDTSGTQRTSLAFPRGEWVSFGPQRLAEGRRRRRAAAFRWGAVESQMLPSQRGVIGNQAAARYLGAQQTPKMVR